MSTSKKPTDYFNEELAELLAVDKPAPVFDILTLLKEDSVHFVKKSVANHTTDYLKVNTVAAVELISKWEESDNEHTLWILKNATRKLNK